MPTPLPRNQVFAYLPPQVNRDALEFGFRVEAGVAYFRSTRALALDFARAIVAACGVTLPTPGRAGVGGPRIAPEKLARMEAARADWQAGRLTQREAAQKHGLHISAFGQWLNRKRRAEMAGTKPLLKPGGRLL
jgi:hypothetical protein